MRAKMSVFEAIAEQKRQADQGWSYASSYNRDNSRAFNNPSTVEEWVSSSSSNSSQQPCGLPVTSSTVTGDNYIVQEVKSSDTDDEVELVDEPGLVLGREEVVLSDSDHSPMAGSGHQNAYTHNSYVHNQHTHPQGMHPNFSLKHSHAHLMEQFHETVQMAPQQGYTHSGSHITPQRHMQLPLHVYEDYCHSTPAQSHNGQQSRSQQQHQSNGQQQGLGLQQQNQLHSQQQNQLHSQQQVVRRQSQNQQQQSHYSQQGPGQLSLAQQHNSHDQQHGAGPQQPSQLLSQQQSHNHQQVVDQQSRGQQQHPSHGQQQPAKPLQRQQASVQSERFHPQQPDQQSSQQTKPHFHQGHILNGPVDSPSMPAQNQLTAQDISASHGVDVKYAAQRHGHGTGGDQHSLRPQHAYDQWHHQQQQPAVSQHQHQLGPNSRSQYIISCQRDYDVNSQYARQLQQDQGSHQHSLQYSPQNSPQVSVQSPPQGSPHTSLENSPQVSLPGSPQLLQNSSSLLNKGSQVLMLHSSHPMQSCSNLSLSNSAQVLKLQNTSQVVLSSPEILQNIYQLAVTNISAASSNNSAQLPCPLAQKAEVNQKGGNHMQIQIPAMVQDIRSVLNLPSSHKIVFDNGKGSQGFQENTYYAVHHSGKSNVVLYDGKNLILHKPEETELKRGCQAKGRSRRQQKTGVNPGSQGGGNSHRRNEKADNVTGLHLAPSHYKLEQGVEMGDSSMTSPMPEAQQNHQELSVPTQHGNSSLLQGSEITCISSDSSPASVVVPRLSATNEIWPTPMPCVKKERSESPPALIVESISSCSQESHGSPDSCLSPGIIHEECKPSPPMQNVNPPATVNPPEEQKAEEPRYKRELAEDEEGTALCKYCGYSSSNFEICEGCKRRLPPDTKLVVKKRKTELLETMNERERTCGGGKMNSSPNNSGQTIDKKTFYGNKLHMHGAAFSSKMEEFSEEFAIKKSGQMYSRRRGAGISRGRSRKPRETKEPETVTISSDEGEDQSGDVRHCLSSSSNHHEEEDDFFSSPLAKPASFGTSRRQRMEDASGQCIRNNPSSPKVIDGLFFNVRGVRFGTMRTSGEAVHFFHQDIHFKIKSDRTQDDLSLKLSVSEIMQIKITFSQAQPVMFFKVTPGCGLRLRSHLKMTENSPEYFDPGSDDTQKNLIVVIIDRILDDKGLRQVLENYKILHINLPDFLCEISYDDANDLLVKSTPPVLPGSYFDRALKSFQLFNSVSSAPSTSLQHLNDQGDGLEDTGEQDEVNTFPVTGEMTSDSPGTLNNQEDRISRSPSPKIGFVGPVEKLLTYPPAPTKGAITITNEDLYCLTEGEFLNDVILDFYLKYLFREKLSEEDRQRTHIFSSFFFKRLTQRQSRSLQEPDVKLTPAQKRHNRVKTWTRHVDIFSKDFLLIPINEHSHWFLAIVCFPGMPAQDYISYHPAFTSVDEDVGQLGDAETVSHLAENQAFCPTDDWNKDSMNDSVQNVSYKGDFVLGKVIPTEVAKKCRSPFKLGLKQACILIMDSLMGPSRNSVIRILKEYLQVEWDLKKGTSRNMLKTVRGCCPKVPQQTNFSDCGVFVLQYAEAFFENPIGNFAIPMKLDKWFPLIKVEKKREEIRDLILQLQAESTR